MTVKTAIDGVRTGIDLLRSIFGLVRDAKDALPESGKKEAITRSLEEAERQLRLAEAQVARALGYMLCQCTFPPQIMLSIGLHKYGVERFQCPHCKKKDPGDDFFEPLPEQRRGC